MMPTAYKLAEGDARRIRALYAEGNLTQRAIGKQFGICQSVVSQIVLGRIHVCDRHAPRKKTPLEARFWQKVSKRSPNECWEWQGVRIRVRGYGQLWHDGRMRLAHRLSWILANDGREPGDLFVLHRCDNPPCVNPAHLFLGSAKDNTQDCIAKGRIPRGPTHWRRRREKAA